MTLANIDATTGNTAIIEAIKSSDPDELRSLLIPGFYIQKDKKAEYLELARNVTNETYTNLNRSSWSDLTRFLKGGIELAAAGIAGFCAYSLYRGTIGVYHHTLVPRNEQGEAIAAPISRYYASWGEKLVKSSDNIDLFESEYTHLASIGSLGVLTLYWAAKGINEWRTVAAAHDRSEHHKRALAVEAIIQRLPACADSSCDTVTTE